MSYNSEPGELKPCLCGKAPKKLNITHAVGYDRVIAIPDCCGWARLVYTTSILESGAMADAIADWNNAPRAESAGEKK